MSPTRAVVILGEDPLGYFGDPKEEGKLEQVNLSCFSLPMEDAPGRAALLMLTFNRLPIVQFQISQSAHSSVSG